MKMKDLTIVEIDAFTDVLEAFEEEQSEVVGNSYSNDALTNVIRDLYYYIDGMGWNEKELK